MEKNVDYASFAREIRRLSLILAHHARSSHSGGALSMADILAVLYSGVLRITPATVDDPDRDRFLLSKGPCCAALYAALAIRGFLDKDDLCRHYGDDGSVYFSPVSHHLNGVEMSSGGLGHGLPVACGIAVNGKVRHQSYNTYVLTGDGELDEGCIWEAAMSASHYGLDYIIGFVDHNVLQIDCTNDEVMTVNPIGDKFAAFGWNVLSIDGHDYEAISAAVDEAKKNVGKPTVIVCETIKGKGVSFMENAVNWHGAAPNAEQAAVALAELRGE